MDRTIISSYAVVILFSTLYGLSAASSVERDTTRYIMFRVLPSDPGLASSLLTALLRSNPSSLRTIRRLLERQGSPDHSEYDAIDDEEDPAARREEGLLAFVDRNRKRSSSIPAGGVDSEDRRAAVAAAAATAALGRRVPEPTGRMKVQNLWKPVRSPGLASKRSLGRCIHECLGKGKMNFIQCKSMCH